MFHTRDTHLTAWANLSTVSKRYRIYREAVTEPPYGLHEVKALIKKIKADQENNEALPAKEYNALTLPQRFTYTMIHGE